MLIEILFLILIGIFAGTFTGLIPGIHVNLISLFVISSSSLFISVNPIYFVVFITSMSITHTFIDFIPSVFLGCPDTDTELSILPGHKLLKEGKGYEAVLLTCYGSLAAIFLLIIISFPSIFFISKTYNLIKNIIPYFLIIISFFLIILEKKKFTSFFIFLLTGTLGYFVLNLNLNEPLLPLLTGLFGSSALIISMKNKLQIPEQILTKPKPKLLRPLLGSLVASPLCSFLPGLGSGQAAIIGNLISKTKEEGFLILIGATNTLVMGFSFISLYSISKTRTGTAVVIQNLLGNLNLKFLILILIISFISGIISFFLTIFLAKQISKRINKINYYFISLITITLLLIVIFFISGFIGLIVFIISTLTGIYCIMSKTRRTNMMGCLLIPTIILYLF